MSMAPTACPFCACGCGFFLLSSNGNLIGVAPSETHPVAGGTICARGWSAHEAPSWGKRLTRPMIRRHGELEADSWTAALDYVVSRLGALRDAGKPIGVLGSPRATNEENYLAGCLARAGLRTNHIDFCYHAFCRPLLEGVEEVAGGPHTIRLRDIESSDAIVLVEGDLAKTHPRAASLVLKAVDSGARLVVIGCARTQMAGVASRFVKAVPGCEGEAINSLLAAVLQRKETRGEVATLCRGYDSLRRNLEALEVSEEIWTAAEEIARAERAAFLIGPASGPADRVRGAAASLTSLAAVTGHLGRPGSGLLLLFARSNVRGACDMGVAPDRLPGYQRIDQSVAREHIERLWAKPLPREPGFDAATMLESVQGLIVVADDPAAVLPMGKQARAALERLEFLVVLDAFETPVANAAHVVLPISSFAETEGTFTSMEDRVQRIRATARLPGEAREGWKVLAELCARFGAGGEWSSARDVFHEIAEAAPSYASTLPLVFDDRWGSPLKQEPKWGPVTLQASPAEVFASPEYPYTLARDGAFDWGSDALVSFSPTLSRDYRSERKLFPKGLVEMSEEDAHALRVRAGGLVKLSSAHGDALVPVRLRKDLEPGVVIAPYGFRESVDDVLGDDGVAAVKLERVGN